MSHDYLSDRRKFVVSGEPKGKGRPRATTFGGHARVYTPTETAVYENHVAQCYLAEHKGKEPYKNGVGIEVHAYFKYPKAAFWPNNKNHHGELRDEWVGQSHVKTPDADNVLKAVLDGLNKANVWGDDSQVCQVVVLKSYATEPRLEVMLWEVGE